VVLAGPYGVREGDRGDAVEARELADGLRAELAGEQPRPFELSAVVTRCDRLVVTASGVAAVKHSGSGSGAAPDRELRNRSCSVASVPEEAPSYL
jgi:hypothetical protein